MACIPISAKSHFSDLFQVLRDSYLIEIRQLLYQHESHVFIYSAYLESTQVAVKILPYTSPAQQEAYMREAHHMVQLRGHPHVVELLGWFMHASQTPSAQYVVLILELYAKDLMQDIDQRAAENFQYTEDELWDFIYVLIETFADMERLSIAHCDVKPHNIFLDRKQVKVGDLGSAQFNSIGTEVRDIVGTIAFLSPALRAGLEGRKTEVKHNVYKSDVYSLGITILAMARLKIPQINEIYTPDLTLMCISQIPYSENLKSLLRYMLEPEEARRVDFTTLFSLLIPRIGLPVSSEEPQNHAPASSPAAPPNAEASVPDALTDSNVSDRPWEEAKHPHLFPEHEGDCEEVDYTQSICQERDKDEVPLERCADSFSGKQRQASSVSLPRGYEGGPRYSEKRMTDWNSSRRPRRRAQMKGCCVLM